MSGTPYRGDQAVYCYVECFDSMVLSGWEHETCSVVLWFNAGGRDVRRPEDFIKIIHGLGKQGE